MLSKHRPKQLESRPLRRHDLAHILHDVDDGDDLKKLTFLFLHRVYSVFCPDKTAKTTELIVKYEDKLRELICSVGGKYLAYGQAEELLASLVNALKAGKRTELNWNVRLEDANRSLDEAIRMMEEAPTDTTRNDAGTSSTDHPRDRTRSRDHAGGASRAPSKGSSKGRSQNTAVESDPASLDHQEVRHDLLALGEDPNHPHVLSQEYLNLIVSGHKSKGSKSLQKDDGGPPVRVSYRAYPGNSWEKYPNNMRYYTKYTCVRWNEGGRWSCTERGKDLQLYEYYQTKPQAMLIFLVAPHRGSAYYAGGTRHVCQAHHQQRASHLCGGK